MKIEKRNKKFEKFSPDKIVYRLKKLCVDKKLGKLTNIDPDIVALKTMDNVVDGIKSSQLDEVAASIAVNMTENLEFQTLASRIIISNMHKSTEECFSEVMEKLANYSYTETDANNGTEQLTEDIIRNDFSFLPTQIVDNIVDLTDATNNRMPLLKDEIIDIIRKNKDILNYAIDYDRDYLFDYFGFKTLEKSYLVKLNGKIIERPQHMYMKIAISLHLNDIDKAIETYNLISQHYFTFASPTLFNSGKITGSYSSCFLLQISDSLSEIFDGVKECAMISKGGGGIGFHISGVRGKNSRIKSNNGKSDGIVPMLRVFDTTSTYANQSGSRKGSFANYCEPYHSDFLEWIDMRLPEGSEDERARNLFYAVWMPDLFMKLLQENPQNKWYLMSSDKCPGLNEVYGETFEKLYWKYVQQGWYTEVTTVEKVWFRIINSQMRTGNPYILYKDSINKKCNEKNLGTIKSSNLCAEITLYTDNDHIAVCNLCSIALPKFLKQDNNNNYYFDHEHLAQVAEYVVEPMNLVIDRTYYPLEKAKNTNLANRPLGIGVQGLADVYCKMRCSFDSAEAKQLNKEIFETLYYGCVKGSIKQAQLHGPYKNYVGSPFSEGKLQFDLAGEFDKIDITEYLSGRWDWESLKQNLRQYGIRNSMLTSLMPTASTAQIMGNNTCFEPFHSCMFKRKVNSGEFIRVNKYLVEDLNNLGLWNKQMRDLIQEHNGSIQHIHSIPDNIKQLYKTIFEYSQKHIIDQAADRQVFIDQTQSMNLYLKEPTTSKIHSMHLYSFNKTPKIKTGMYYLYSEASANQGKFTIMQTTKTKLTPTKEEEGEECLNCSA